jgi:hypothetical protein
LPGSGGSGRQSEQADEHAQNADQRRACDLRLAGTAPDHDTTENIMHG